MAKKENDSAIGYVILGIVAIMAIVGLVLLFTTASATGQVARTVYVGFDSYPGQAAPYRVGEPPQPVAYQNQLEVAGAKGANAQVSIS